MASLAELLAQLAQVEETPDEKPGFRLSDAVAQPGVKPFSWQSPPPDDLFRKGDPVGDSSDLQRILALKRRPGLDALAPETVEAVIELEMAKYGKHNDDCNCKEIDPQAPVCLKRLLPMQAWMLREIAMNQGLIASAATGGGKTLVGLLAPLALTNVKQVLMLIPPSLVDQIQHDYKLASQHFKMPGFIMHIGNRKPDVRPVVIDGVPTLHVLPYSRLSMPEESDFLQRLSPDAIICDEVDAVKSMQSSRGIRLAKWFSGGVTDEEKKKRRATKFLGWTGSLVDHSMCEFNWLCLFALRERSPLPLDPMIVEEWGRCLDATGTPAPAGELMQFCNEGEDVRHGVRRRLAETPGFVVANSGGVEITGGDGLVELDIREKAAPALPPIIQLALSMVRKGERPDTLIPEVRPDLAGECVGIQNDQLEDAMAIARAAQEVSVGVLYFFRFPNREPEPLIKEWMLRKSRYFSAVREQTYRGETFLDSAMLCEQAAMRFWGNLDKREDRPEWRCEEWPGWFEIRDKVKPVTDSCVLHPFICEDAVEWGRERPGIIWYGMSALATKMAEISGFTVHDGGPDGGRRLRQENGKRTIISSIKSNGRGRNGLQYVFDRSLITNPPASATGFEQLLARQHRRGQPSIKVTAEIYTHTPELKKAVEQAKRRSRFVKDILGADQKLLDGWKGVDDEPERG